MNIQQLKIVGRPLAAVANLYVSGSLKQSDGAIAVPSVILDEWRDGDGGVSELIVVQR